MAQPMKATTKPKISDPRHGVLGRDRSGPM
jgi:hypothetical protein